MGISEEIRLGIVHLSENDRLQKMLVDEACVSFLKDLEGHSTIRWPLCLQPDRRARFFRPLACRGA
jgi:hypothetical protein